jgi:3-oxoadipate enol-lactonase
LSKSSHFHLFRKCAKWGKGSFAVPFARINKITTWYQESGQGSALPVIFVNSLGTDHRIWDGVVDRLAGNRRCIAYDKRGHGMSDLSPHPYAIADLATDLLALADHCGIERFVVCGVSVGGMIALASAAAAPDRIAGLVLCDTAPRIGTPDMWNIRIGQARNDGLSSIADNVMERWFSAGFRATRQDELAGWRNLLIRTPADGYAATCAAIRDVDLTVEAQSIEVPALVIAGADDLSTPPDLVRSLAELVPDAQFEIMASVGHIPSIEQPDLLATLLGDFLETLPHE